MCSATRHRHDPIPHPVGATAGLTDENTLALFRNAPWITDPVLRRTLDRLRQWALPADATVSEDASARSAEPAEDSLWVVGGATRDLLLGRDCYDIDVVIAPQAGSAAAQDPERPPLGRRLSPSYRVWRIEAAPYTIDFTLPRKDFNEDGRHAATRPSTFEDDAGRRDFSCNAIYGSSTGHVWDPYHGIEALRQRHVRFIGRPEDRIAEDYLRTLRWIRMNAILHNLETVFDPPRNEAQACVEAASKANEVLSRERVREEVFKMMQEPGFGCVITYPPVSQILDTLLCPRELCHAGDWQRAAATMADSNYADPVIGLASAFATCAVEMHPPSPPLPSERAIEALRTPPDNRRGFIQNAPLCAALAERLCFTRVERRRLHYALDYAVALHFGWIERL